MKLYMRGAAQGILIVSLIPGAVIGFLICWVHHSVNAGYKIYRELWEGYV